MAKKYVSVGQLSIASELLNFVNYELLPNTGINKKRDTQKGYFIATLITLKMH